MRIIKTAKKYEAEIRALKATIKDLSEIEKDVRADREKFRTFFAREFKWHIQLLGNNEHPTMTALLEKEAKFLSTVRWWPW
jgi:hypothetical protein